MYDYRRKGKSKRTKLVFALSLTLIAVGLSLFLCADMTDASYETAFVAEMPREAAAAETPALSAEEAAPPLLSASDVPAAESSAAPPESAKPPAAASDVPAAQPQSPAVPAETQDAPAEAPAAQSPGDAEDSEDAGMPEDATPSVTVSASVSSAGGSAQEGAERDAAAETPAPGLAADAEIDDYFSDALFIGDSRTQGLLLYSNLGNASYYAARGLTVEQAFKKPVVDAGGGKLTVSDALDRRAFGKVYLMFGLNELGWNSADKFIETYGTLLDRVKETQPDAVIYVQAIMPVSAWKSEKDPVHNNSNILRFNEMILQLAEDKGVVYLNVGESVSDGAGVLPDEASSDGIHLNKKYCIKWEEYLRTHTV
jgi:lysophospholipase L1-like esterase